jgi:homoserine kinase
MVVSKVTVRVPASTANLGPGFDCLGMALGLYNTVTVQVTRGRLDVRIKGEGAEELRWGEENRVLRAIRLAFEEAGQRLPSLALEQQNEIPLGRGLGSSSAATVAGLVAGNALCGNPLSEQQILVLGTQLERHPDNVAPALLGGLVIVVQDDTGLLYNRIPTPADLEAALFVPEFSMPTDKARRVLPQDISRSDAVHNLGRVALLVSAFLQGRYELLDAATRDRLHQPYREAMFPAMPELFTAARQAGALGVFLSGAGSTILALCRGNGHTVAEAMATTARKKSVAGQPMVVPVSSKGVQTKVVKRRERRRRRREAEDHW